MQAIEPSAIAAEAAVPIEPRPPRTWYFLGSTLFGLGVYAVQILVAAVVTFVMLAGRDLPRAASVAEMQAQLPGWLYITAIATTPFTLAALWVPIRIARRGFAEYLALLRWPSRREIAWAIAGIVAIELIWMLAGYLAGLKTPPFILADYRTIRDAGLLPVYLAALCIAAPVGEEFLIRGFVFQGWSQSFLRPAGAILLTSVLWTSMHTRYDWFYRSEVFAVGLLFGYWRYRSGSTWLTTMAHTFMNAASVVEIWLLVAYGT